MVFVILASWPVYPWSRYCLDQKHGPCAVELAVCCRGTDALSYVVGKHVSVSSLDSSSISRVCSSFWTLNPVPLFEAFDVFLTHSRRMVERFLQMDLSQLHPIFHSQSFPSSCTRFHVTAWRRIQLICRNSVI